MPLRTDIIGKLRPQIDNNDQSLLTAFDITKENTSDLYIIVQLFNQADHSIQARNHQAIATNITNLLTSSHSSVTVVLLDHQNKGSVSHIEGNIVTAIKRGQSNYAILLVKTNNYSLLPPEVLDAITRSQKKSCQAYFTLCQLSDSQHRLAYLDQEDKNKAVHNEMAFDKIFGDGFNLAVFIECLKEMYTRHDALRTSIHLDCMQQVIWPIEFIQQTITYETEISKRGSKIIPSDPEIYRKLVAQEPFKLVQAPLMRHKIIQLENNKYRWWAIFHHGIYDGFSNQIFLNELRLLYMAKTTSSLPSVSKPSRHLEYVDYCIWQNNLPAEKKQAQFKFWQDNLNGVVFPDMPTDANESSAHARKVFAGAREPIFISKENLTLLKKIASEQNTTLFNVLLTCYFILFFRYTGQSDITIGTMTANRKKHEFQGKFDHTIGFLAIPLLIRIKIDGNLSFLYILDSVKNAVKQALSNSDIPFGEVMGMLEQPFSGPLMVLQDPQYQSLTLPSVAISSHENGTGLAKFPLAFELRETADNGLSGCIEYNSLRYSKSTVEQIVGHFTNILRIITLPDAINKLLHDIEFLTEKDRQVQNEIKNTSQPIPKNKDFIRLLEDSFNRHAKKNAVIFRGLKAPERLLTFADLNVLAENLGCYLLKKTKKGIRLSPSNRSTPERVIIGICLPRSPEMIIAIIAALKINAIIVPLDSEKENLNSLKYKLQEAKCTHVISTQQLNKTLLQSFTGKKIIIDKNKRKPDQNKTISFQRVIDLNKPIFRFFTSGTTGVAKVLDTPDGGWCNWVYWAAEQHHEDLVIYPSAPFVADAFMWDVLLGLVRGFPIVLNPDEERLNSESIASLAKLYGINSGIWTPSNFSVIRPEDMPAAKVFYLTGQNCPDAIIKAYLLRKVKIYNAFGESEAVCGEAFYECGLGKQIRIGRPMRNRRFAILDAFRKPVPIGYYGELCVMGEYMGYYPYNPSLTAQKIIDDPDYPPNSGHKLFFTGHKARFLPDGNIQLGGRMNYASRVIKHYGVRIDLDALEGILITHPNIAYVAVKEFKVNDSQYFAAYFTTKKGKNLLSYNDLRTFLLNRGFPTIQIPTHFEHLFHMPTSPNGKVDYAKLPIPQLKPVSIIPRAVSVESKLQKDTSNQLKLTVSRAGIQRNSSANHAELLRASQSEEIMSQIKIIMSELLQHSIGFDDDFFDYGGNSLSKVKLVERIMALDSMREYSDVTRTDLLKLNTVRQFSEFFASKDTISPESSVTELSINVKSSYRPILAPDSPKIPLFIYIHDITGRCYSLQPVDTALAKLIHTKEGIKILRIYVPSPFRKFDFKHDSDNAAEIPKSIDEIAASYIKLLTSKYSPDTYSYNLIGYSLGGLIALEMLKSLNNQDHKYVNSVIVIDTPFSLDRLSKEYRQQIYQTAAHLARLYNIPCEETPQGELAIKYLHLEQIITLDIENMVTTLFDTLIKYLPDFSQNNINVFTAAKYLCLAAHRYQPNFPIRATGNVVQIIATEGTKKQYKLNDDLGWGKFFDELQSMTVSSSDEYDSDHFSIMNPTFCERLAEILFQRINNQLHYFTVFSSAHPPASSDPEVLDASPRKQEQHRLANKSFDFHADCPPSLEQIQSPRIQTHAPLPIHPSHATMLMLLSVNQASPNNSPVSMPPSPPSSLYGKCDSSPLKSDENPVTYRLLRSRSTRTPSQEKTESPRTLSVNPSQLVSSSTRAVVTSAHSNSPSPPPHSPVPSLQLAKNLPINPASGCEPSKKKHSPPGHGLN